MQLTLARPLDWPWRFVLLTSYAIVNVVLTLMAVRLGPEYVEDWHTFEAVVRAANPYAVTDPIPFVWSPVTVPLIEGIAALGYWPWVVAHVAVVFLLRSPLLIGLVLVSYGFAFDTAQGNTLTFSLIAGMLALRGSRAGSLAYLALLVLIPRPLLVPLGAWIVWRQPEMRWPFAAMIVAHAAIVLASGLAGEWIAAVLAYGGPAWDIGPTAIVGAWWLVVGVPLAGWLTLRGRIGWAGLAMSPYILPQYLAWPLVELEGRKR